MQELTALIWPEIDALLREGPSPASQAQLRELVVELHPADIADLLEALAAAPAAALFELLDNSQQREVFEFLAEEDQLQLLEQLGLARMAPVIEGMSSDDRADLIKVLPEPTVQRLLPLVAQAERNDIRRLVQYEEGTAGAIMSTEYAALPAELTVDQALAQLRQVAPHRETIYYVYLVDAGRRLLGVLSLQELILARPEQRLAALMHANPIHVQGGRRPAGGGPEAVLLGFHRAAGAGRPAADGGHRHLRRCDGRGRSRSHRGVSQGGGQSGTGRGQSRAGAALAAVSQAGVLAGGAGLRIPISDQFGSRWFRRATWPRCFRSRLDRQPDLSGSFSGWRFEEQTGGNGGGPVIIADGVYLGADIVVSQEGTFAIAKGWGNLVPGIEEFEEDAMAFVIRVDVL